MLFACISILSSDFQNTQFYFTSRVGLPFMGATMLRLHNQQQFVSYSTSCQRCNVIIITVVMWTFLFLQNQNDSFNFIVTVINIVTILDVNGPVVRVGSKSVQKINSLCEVEAVHKQTSCVLVDINQLYYWDE